MEVSGLFVYPVKSLRGIALRRSLVGLRGLRHDRRWMIVDESGRFQTQRETGRMARVSTALADGLVLSTEGAGSITAPFEPQGPTIEATIWRWTGPVDLVDPCVDRWLSEVLEMPCRLVAMRHDMDRLSPAGGQVAFSDGNATLVAGEASLEALNGKLEVAAPMNRFRPNIVLRGSAAYEEDGWPMARVGDVDFAFVKRCGRCIVTTTDQATGERNPQGEPLKTLARERLFDGAACFGAFFAPLGEGEIAVGDRVVAG